MEASFSCLSRGLVFLFFLIKKLGVLDWFSPCISVCLYLFGWQEGPVSVTWGFASELSRGSTCAAALGWERGGVPGGGRAVARQGREAA